jgi:DNA-binding transcriptional LysR family regulator
MLDMNDFRYFMTIVDKGGFTAAGRALGVPTSTLSYRMKQLEGQLGIGLLVRTSRQVSMTPAGMAFYRHAVATVERADAAESEMRHNQIDPSGTVRYTVGSATAQFAMPRMINSFMLKYPKIDLIQHTADHFVDIVAERYDVAIRGHINALPDSNLIQRPLVRIPWHLFASPFYLQQRGEPERPADLTNHTTLYVRRENEPHRWPLSNPVTGETEELTLSPRLSCICITSIKEATKAGSGISALPAYICKEELKTGELKLVLPEWIAANMSLTALMPSRAGIGGPVRAFIDHLAETCFDAVRFP